MGPQTYRLPKLEVPLAVVRDRVSPSYPNHYRILSLLSCMISSSSRMSPSLQVAQSNISTKSSIRLLSRGRSKMVSRYVVVSAGSGKNLLILAVAVFEQNQYDRKGTSCLGWSGNTFVVVTGRSVVVSWMILSSLGSRNFGNVRQPDFPLRAAAYPRHMWLKTVAEFACWAQLALQRPTRPFSGPTITMPARPTRDFTLPNLMAATP